MFKFLPWSTFIVGQKSQLTALISDMRMSMILITAAIFIISLIAAFAIPNDPGTSPKAPRRRKFVYWLGLSLLVVIFFLYIFSMRQHIASPTIVPGYYTQTFVFGGIMLGVYLAIGFALSKSILKRSSYGDIFGKGSK